MSVADNAGSMASPTVTVVIPVFNRAGLLRASVESVLRQTFTDFELLVVDDGSTDGTMLELDELADPRIRRLANSHNLGAGAARNAGIRAARGRWVAFQDSEDEWLPTKLEKQMARLETAGSDCVAAYCGMIVVGEVDGPVLGRTPLRYVPEPSVGLVEGDLQPSLLRDSLVSTQTLVVRRDSLLACGGFDESLPALEDWDCALRLAEMGTFVFLDEPLVLQRFSANSITRSRHRRLTARITIVKKHLHAMQEYPTLLAGHYRAIAGDQRRLGQWLAARASLSKARRLTPLNPALWAMGFYLWVAQVWESLTPGAIGGSSGRTTGPDLRAIEALSSPRRDKGEYGSGRPGP